MNCNQNCQQGKNCTCDDIEAMPLQALGLAGFAVLLIVLCAAAVYILPLVMS